MSAFRLGKRQYIDKTFWVIFIILVVVSIIALFSASSSLIRTATAQGHNPLYPIAAQILYLLLGVALAYGIQFLPSWLYRLAGYALLGLGLLFLMLNAAHIGVTINGATRWVRILGITIQSSEIAKIGLIIVVADLLTRIKDKQTEKKYFLWVLALTGVTCILIMFSNLSTALLLGAVVLVIMFLARVRWYWILGIVGTAAIVLVSGYFYVKKVYVDPGREMHGVMGRAVTWVSRIDNKMKEDRTDNSTIRVNDSNLQATLARVAVARGGQSPFGVLPGNSLERNHLPLAYADYIFAIIVEETGFIGALLLCLLYMSILFRACLTSSRYSDYSAQLMVMGLGLMITLQALVSMAVAVGLGPVTGQPLPMISKGGTSAIITSIYFGIMMGVSREQNELHAQQEQTITESMETVPDIETE
ncbi:MAG: FtsW/RodA/SpoVE family cell cycle protein [Paludibacteraceae bacterium]|nr:FtsW/RodA/SpoVE family cell cycle protein [Paludibacteraceae bacterium]